MNKLSYEWPLGVSRGVHKKPQVLVCDLVISTNQQGQGVSWFPGFPVKGSEKSQGRKFLFMQIFNFNKKVKRTQKCVQLICIRQ